MPEPVLRRIYEEQQRLLGHINSRNNATSSAHQSSAGMDTFGYAWHCMMRPVS